MIVLLSVLLGIALIIAAPVLLVLGLIVVLLPFCFLIWVVEFVVKVLLWKPKDPWDDNFKIEQVNQQPDNKRNKK